MEPYQYNLLRYFEESAGRYISDIEPVFSPLAAFLVSAASLHPGDRVLDLGAGTGIAARLAASHGCTVAAVDFSRGMVAAAAAQATPGIVQGDMHWLPFRDSTFDTVLAVFALNSTVPLAAMEEARRVLRPGGRLALQEWGTRDPISDLLGETLLEYAVDDPPPDLARRRSEQQALHPWDELETSDDIARLMRAAGFAAVEVRIETASVLLENAAAFIRYKLAWPIRRAEIDAMPSEIRQLCLTDLEENIGKLADKDGRLSWQPNVVQVFGLKPLS